MQRLSPKVLLWNQNMFFKICHYQEELFKPCCLIWIAIFFLQQILLILRCAARHMFPQQPLQARNGTPTWHHTLCEKSQPRPPTIGSKNPYSSHHLENSGSSSGYLSLRLCCFTRDWNASQSIEAPQQEILNAISLWRSSKTRQFLNWRQRGTVSAF